MNWQSLWRPRDFNLYSWFGLIAIRFSSISGESQHGNEKENFILFTPGSYLIVKVRPSHTLCTKRRVAKFAIVQYKTWKLKFLLERQVAENYRFLSILNIRRCNAFLPEKMANKKFLLLTQRRNILLLRDSSTE